MSQPKSPLAFVTPSCPAGTREAMMQLERLRTQRPELETLAVLHAELITTLFQTPSPLPSHTSPISNISLDRGLTEQFERGTPLFRIRAPQVDAGLILSHWKATCQILAKHRDRAEPDRLYHAASTGAISVSDTVFTILRAGPNEYRQWLRRNDFDVQLGASVLRFTALPILAAQAALLQSFWHKLGWPHGYCPACGSWPLLAESRGLEQFRWLRCGLCGSGWQVDRIFCPFCESRDHRKLHDLFVEGDEQKQRICLCDECNGFVRVVSTLTELSVPSLLVMDLETLHLELLAIERGYSVPTGNDVDQ